MCQYYNIIVVVVVYGQTGRDMRELGRGVGREGG